MEAGSEMMIGVKTTWQKMKKNQLSGAKVGIGNDSKEQASLAVR